MCGICWITINKGINKLISIRDDTERSKMKNDGGRGERQGEKIWKYDSIRNNPEWDAWNSGQIAKLERPNRTKGLKRLHGNFPGRCVLEEKEP